MNGRVWLFDLDNTLHDARPHIFPHINRAMTRYVAETLSLSEAQANHLRLDYWQRYGATLSGLIRNHQTNPAHFLWHTHQIPHLESLMVFERGLRAMLRRLPGRKILFTNGPQHYAKRVLRVLRIEQYFDALYGIEQLGLQPKPDVRGFLRLLKTERLAASRCIMVEDSAENLKTAHMLGMRTVLISQRLFAPNWVDVRLKSVLELPRHTGLLKPRRIGS